MKVFTPKDKLADWFEYYAGVLELNVWTGTTLETSEWSESARQWTVDLVRESNGNKETSD
jgi:cation diffusion facilitator CzcD-associated flavoprotein CzcO